MVSGAGGLRAGSGVCRVEEKPLRIGELAARAGVSTRTVDYYTGLGLLAPVRRSGGNFRLYHSSDVRRITAIRQLEAQGIRLEDITHLLTTSARDDHSDCTAPEQGPCPADPAALTEYLTSLDAQVLALHNAAEVADPQVRGVVAALTARAQTLLATAVALSSDVLPVIEHLPHL